MPSLESILNKLADREISKQEAARLIRRDITIDGYEKVAEIAKLDTARLHRVGIPEVVLAEGKNAQDLVAIVEAQLKVEGRVVITRFQSTSCRHSNTLTSNGTIERASQLLGKNRTLAPVRACRRCVRRYCRYRCCRGGAHSR